ncbi:MAG: LptF/LptG family permease [Phycisphaerales bacterium]|nr:LptF/LptG family permease [Phycisphaerales bacterium]
MPWILHRHMFAEVARVVVLTTVVVVMVVAFGAVIKPMSSNLLGPGGIAKYVAIATVPMLQFALPFAAGFGATLVTHRFAAENELLAMSTSGMRWSAILLPQALLGTLLGGVMFVLVQSAVPRFWGLAEQVVADDAAQVFVATIRRGEAFQAGNMLICADAIAMAEPSPGSQAEQRIVMEGVVALETDPTSKAVTEFVARGATVDLYGRGGDLLIKIAMSDATVIRPQEGTVIRLPTAEPGVMSMDRSWERSPKYLPYMELQAVIANPELGPRPRDMRGRIVEALGLARIYRSVERELAEGRPGRVDHPESGRAYEISDARISSAGIVPAPPARQVTVREFADGRLTREAATSQVTFVATEGAGSQGRFDMVLAAPEARAVLDGQGRPTRWPARIVGVLAPGLTDADGSARAAAAEAAPALRAEIDELSSRASVPWSASMREVNALRARWEHESRRIVVEARSHEWMRVAQSVAVPLVVMLGTVLAVLFRSSLPLTVYFLSFLPALAEIILVASGQSIYRNGSTGMGLAVMWSGHVVLAALLALSWWRVAGH